MVINNLLFALALNNFYNESTFIGHNGTQPSNQRNYVTELPLVTTEISYGLFLQVQEQHIHSQATQQQREKSNLASVFSSFTSKVAHKVR